MKILSKILGIIGLVILSAGQAFSASEEASAEFSFYLPEYLHIRPITSPVLTANITNRTGDLHAPLNTRFRVTSNAKEKRTLYLKANVVTSGGYEEAIFEQGGQVYIAFASLRRIPSSSALHNCKAGGEPKDSPGIVAYPVTNISGAEHKFIKGKNKYEVYVGNGTTDIDVNIGAHVLKNSFAGNDPHGFYQAVLSLTESDI